MGSIVQFLGLKLVSLIQAILFSVSMHLLPQFGSYISAFTFRLQRDGSSLEKNDKETTFVEEVEEFKGLGNESEEEEQVEYLTFKFPAFEEFIRIHEVFPVDEIEPFPVNEEINGNKISDFCENKMGLLDEKSEHISNEILVCKGEENEDTQFGVKSEEKEESFQEDEESHHSSDWDSLNFEHFGSVLNHFSDPSYSDDFLSDEEESPNEENQQLSNNSYESNSEKSESYDSEMCDLNSMDEVKMETLWEHQDLIDQLKMELRKVKATMLPTILEECESPKIMDDLKPWKIDKKFPREDPIGELHSFHRSYGERMRKFDILNYQRMYATGFLKLKVPLQAKLKKKPSAPILKSLISQNLWLSKHRIQATDPLKKFVDEVQGDLEVVYVGQMCLSWEILHWQYEKVLDLWDSDPRGNHRYNEVAGDFQQFQVLMERFMENERFQGPRVQNYVQNRCVHRNFLQVPVVRMDNMRDKKWKAWKKDRDEYVITSDVLVEIVQESIRIFWRFVKADKDCNSMAINGHKKMPELSNPEDLELLIMVRKNLQKKERKLKEILRSENCILRRFQRCRDRQDEWDQVLCFFSQVDMKLVSRVLKMSRITREQLMWCHNKLERISFVNRRMCVEPSFSLFPC